MFIDIKFNNELVLEKIDYIIFDIDGKLIKLNNNDMCKDLEIVDTIVGYDIDYLMIGFYRLNNIDLIDKLISKKRVCLKEMGKIFLNNVNYPSLKEIYRFIFGYNNDNIDDLTMCHNCYFEIIYNNFMRKR
jgi:hypothetical protein